MSRSRVRDCDSAIALTESADAGARACAHPRPRRVARQCQRRMLTEEGIASRWKIFACLSRLHADHRRTHFSSMRELLFLAVPRSNRANYPCADQK